MKALHDSTQNLQAERLAAGVAARVAAIFDELPTLCGFSVQERSTLTKDRAVAPLQGELCLADVSVSTWPGMRAPLELYEEIVFTLLELVDEQPEAVDFLSGRTFARTLH
jgi:hypothetical protein